MDVEGGETEKEEPRSGLVYTTPLIYSLHKVIIDY